MEMEQATPCTDKIVLAEQIEYGHFSAGTGEVTAPRPYTNNPLHGETYTFAMPSSPIPKWMQAIVTRRTKESLPQE